MSALILGVGNILLQDEGIGVRIVEELQRRFAWPDDIELLDGGTAGISLLDTFVGKKQVLIIDAIRSDKPVGTVIKLENDAVPAFFSHHLTPHQLGISDILGALTLTDQRPEQLVLLGIVPKSLELTVSLSPELVDHLDAIIAQVVQQVTDWGYNLSPKK